MTTQSVRHAEPLHEDQVQIVLRGDLPGRARRWALAALHRALRHRTGPLTAARVTLRPADDHEGYHAEMLVTLRGRVLKAHADADIPQAALDLAAERLGRQVDGLHRRLVTARTHHRHGHDAAPPAGPDALIA